MQTKVEVEMVYQDLYWNAALVYFAGALGFFIVMLKLTSGIKWLPLRLWFLWVYLCLVLTPWQGTDPEVYFAPAIIVAAFDFLDLGINSILVLLRPMINSIVFGTMFLVVFGIYLKLKSIRRLEAESQNRA